MAETPGDPRDHAHAALHRRLGRAGQPRRARRRHHRRRRQHAQRAARALLHRRASSTRRALPVTDDPDVRDPGSFSMRGHSVGGFGSVTTNKVIATIAGEVFGKDVQAYPKYGSEKKGLPTTYYLTIAEAAHPRALRTGAGRVRAAQRRQRLQPGEPADGALAKAAWSSCRATEADPSGGLGVGPGMGAQGHDARRTRGCSPGHGRDRPRGLLAGRPAAAHAGHRAAGRFPAAHAVPGGARA